MSWRILFDELIHIFREIKNNGDGNNQRNGEEKSSQELFDDVNVDFLHTTSAGLVF